MPRIFDKIRRIAAIRKSSGTIHLTNFSPCVIICLPFCYMAFSYNMTTVVKQLKVWRGAQLASPLSAVACSLFPIGLGVRNFLRIRFFRGNPKITLRIAMAVIANAIVAVTHTRYFRFSPKIPLPTRYARSPLTTAQGAAVKERGHLTAALLYRAGSAVPRDAKRNLVNIMQLDVLILIYG